MQWHQFCTGINVKYFKKLFSVAAALFGISSTYVSTAKSIDTTNNASHYARLYLSNAIEGGIFSVASLSNAADGKSDGLTTLRFSYVVNTGTLVNYNISESVGLFLGAEIKNIGYIEKSGDYTIKRRTYTIGAPVGLKIGDMTQRGAYFFAGGGFDAPFNYREKKFIARNNKAKFNEWFIDHTPAILPYAFIGYKFTNQLQLKFQYYPGNFLNQDYTDKAQLKPYQNTTVHLMYLSVGYHIRYGTYTRWKGNWVKRSMI